MENSDKISSDAIDERRVARLEQIVGNYRIVVAGCDGMIKGGFGELRSGSTLQERIANLQQAISEFRLKPSNIQLSGRGLKNLSVNLPDDDITGAALGS
jgi:hypothetical protein